MPTVKEEINLEEIFYLLNADKPSEICKPPFGDKCFNEALFKIFFEYPCEHFSAGSLKCLYHKDVIVNFLQSSKRAKITCSSCGCNVGKVNRVEKL